MYHEYHIQAISPATLRKLFNGNLVRMKKHHVGNNHTVHLTKEQYHQLEQAHSKKKLV